MYTLSDDPTSVDFKAEAEASVGGRTKGEISTVNADRARPG